MNGTGTTGQKTCAPSARWIAFLLVSSTVFALTLIVWVSTGMGQPPGYGGSSDRSRTNPVDDDDRPRPPGAGGPSAAPQPEEKPLPEEISLWRKEHYYQARRTGHPRLREAVAYLGKHFAGVTRDRKNEKAATLLTNLLKVAEGGGAGGAAGGYAGMGGPMSSYSGGSGPPAGYSGGSGPPAGYSGGSGPPAGYSGGSGPPAGYSGGGGPSSSSPGGYGMPGTGGAPGATQPARPLDPATIAAIVDALAVNGSGRARKTIREVLAGTFLSDSDRAAAEAALICLLTYPSPESEDLFLTILVSPEKVRSNPAGQNPSAGGMSTGYSATGSMPSGYSATGSMPSGYSATGSMPSGYSATGSMPSGYGSSGYGGGGQGKWTSAELQAKAVELFDRVASEAFRLAVAKRLVNPATPALARGLLSRSLLGPSPRNVAAQVLLHGSPTIDREAKAALERQFTKNSSDALARMMNVPFQATLVPSGGRGAGSGYPGASGMPPGYPRPGGPSGAYPGGTAPSRGPRGDDDDDRRAPMGYQAYPGAGGASMMAAPGADATPGAALGLALGGPGGTGPLGADADLSFRVAQQLWGKQLTASIEAQLGQIESLPQGASGVLLASTVPADAVRAKLYLALRRFWDEGPRALEDAGLGTSLFSDPGFLVVMKALPRKDAPAAQAAPVRIHRNSRRGTGGPGGTDASGRPGGSYGPEGGGAYPGRSGPAQQPPKDADKPEYAWMGACEDLARAMCDQLMPAGRRRSTLAGGADGPSAENRPVEIPGNVTPVSEYRFEWPKDLSSGRSKLAGVPLDPMSVYYVRMSVNAAPTKVMSYYRRQLARPVEHQADVGYWLESVRTDEETKRRVSVDVLIAKKAERDAARAVRPGGDGTSSPYGMQPGMGSPTGGSSYGPGSYGPPGGTGRGDTLPQKPEKDTVTDLIVEVLVVEINNPAGTEEPAKKGKKDKRAAETDGF